ncbi:TraB/GumN family protein [Myroides sp. NP-2]|uniref:TraB/GumN family protein n=1 Tax=Myroides sp. NP-2 TaxID=2759945 RepID=UPI0015FD66B8|nr:TraB/GumN family protein [Myroides sp. NP-2]MBB1150802.1 TraB/GumN family protein [Myroides sp. NP-2]
MRHLLFLTYFLVFNFGASSAQNTIDKSNLWEISGNGLKESSYLLGTFHLLCETDLQVSEKVLTAIEAVEQIALEVNLVDPNELLSLQDLLVSSTTLSSQLSESEQIEFRTLLQSKYGMDASDVDHMPPFLLMGMLATKNIPCAMAGYDMAILQLGLDKNKNILGLERFKDQIDLTNRIYSAKEVLAQLKEKENAAMDFESMVNAFNQEDIEALYRIVIDPKSLSSEGKRLLLDNRNRMWIEKMVHIMPTASTLFAVGAGHLAGEAGVIALLTEKGFTVQAILN